MSSRKVLITTEYENLRVHANSNYSFRFYGFIVDRMPYLLVMEYCDGGSVEDKLRAHPKVGFNGFLNLNLKIPTFIIFCGIIVIAT